MNETAAPPHTEPTSIAGRYGLVRPREHRQVAGVCAAVARVTDTDPLLWRVLVAVGVLFGGVGLVAYLLGWLLMPEEGDTGSPLEALLGRGRSGTSGAVTILLAVAAALLLVLTVEWTPIALAVLAAVGYVMYRQRKPPAPWHAATSAAATDPGTAAPGTASQPEATPDAGPNPVPDAARDATAGTTPGAAPGTARPDVVPDAAPRRDQVTVPVPPEQDPVESDQPVADGPASEREDAPVSERETVPVPVPGAGVPATENGATEPLAPAEHYRGGGTAPPAEPAGPAGPTEPGWQGGGGRPLWPEPPPVGTEPPAPERRPRSALGRVALFAMLAAIGLVALMHQAGAQLGFSAYVAAALAVTGGALLVGTWYGRARWLIGLGALLTVVLAVSAATESVDLTADGDRTWRPPTVAHIEPDYNVNLGNGTLDLRHLDFTGHDLAIDLKVNNGNLTVLLPPDVDVSGGAKVGFGNAVLVGDEISATTDTEHSFSDLGRDGVPGPGHLTFDVKVNLGNLEIQR